MTDEREALVAAIAAEPDDDTPRLVFADWLQENGEEDRAEFVRLECEIERAWPPHIRGSERLSPRVSEQLGQARDLFDLRWPFWVEDFCRALGAAGEGWPGATPGWFSRLVRQGARNVRRSGYCLDPSGGRNEVMGWGDWPVRSFSFNRGFVGHLDLNFEGSRPARDLAAAFRREPVSRLKIDLTPSANAGHWPAWNVLCLRRVGQLTLALPTLSYRKTIAALESLAHGEHWTGLRELSLWPIAFHEVDPSENYAAILAGSPLLSGLETLQVTTSIPVLRRLTTSRRLANLRCFEAWWGSLPPETGEILAGATFRDHLEQLWLLGDELGDEGVRALVQHPWPRLRSLSLGSRTLGDAGARHLLPLLPQLSELSLASSTITDAGALAIAEAIDPEKFRSLCLSYNPLSPGVVQTLRDRFGDRFSFRTDADEERNGLG